MSAKFNEKGVIMIDYCVTNGRSSHYKDIDLLENKSFDVEGAPSPKDIQYQRKMEFVSRTMRINEFVDASLRVLAEECGMSFNKLLNAILEGYVNKHQEQIGGGEMMKEYVLNNYLDRLVLDLTDTRLSLDKKKWERTIRHEEKSLFVEGECVIQDYFYKHFFSVVIFKPKKNAEVACYEKIDRELWSNVECCGCDYELIIPEKKWYTVMSVLDRYLAKCNALGKNRHIDDDSMQRLVDVINNSKTNKTIVKNLTRALRHSTRLGAGGEKGSIWERSVF